MAKVTKTQIMHVHERLKTMMETKMDVLKASLPQARDHDVDTMEAGLQWASENPTKFVQLCKTVEAEKRRTSSWRSESADLEDICKATPPVIAARKKVDSVLESNAERISTANVKLLQEISRIIDSLYFADCDDAKLALAEFEKFTV